MFFLKWNRRMIESASVYIYNLYGCDSGRFFSLLINLFICSIIIIANFDARSRWLTNSQIVCMYLSFCMCLSIATMHTVHTTYNASHAPNSISKRTKITLHHIPHWRSGNMTSKRTVIIYPVPVNDPFKSCFAEATDCRQNGFTRTDLLIKLIVLIKLQTV